MTAKKSKPRGRPALAPAEKKRRNFTFRGTDELHDHISKAAAESGRSISEEIEWRLGQSFFMKDAVRWAVEATVAKTFAYVDEQRAKERAQGNSERPFLDIVQGIMGDEQ
ncbi:hypothetical protein [Bradyrhizobium sp. CB2312]|uniref:hypothetical protein n=1 Tax=Bradyrhizobium sp. CB2312 TaxID=3039155 RepID=UPI0024B10596|nr:hypothetical protein [Bradyrhizobium sp. CB2312]WFU68598.1 hypothetical protein QA642_25050 [Bradyrhizobium sp. CB2312]